MGIASWKIVQSNPKEDRKYDVLGIFYGKMVQSNKPLLLKMKPL